MDEVHAGMAESRAAHAAQGSGAGGDGDEDGDGDGGLLAGSTHVDGSVEGYAPGGSLARDAEARREREGKA